MLAKPGPGIAKTVVLFHENSHLSFEFSRVIEYKHGWSESANVTGHFGLRPALFFVVPNYYQEGAF